MVIVIVGNNISDAPQASLQLGGSLKADEIQEGKDVYLDCKVQSNPYTNDVGWMFNGKQVFSTSAKRFPFSKEADCDIGRTTDQ